MAKLCEKCKRKDNLTNMGHVSLEVSIDLWYKGYVDKDFFLCEECLKNFMDI